MANRIYEYVVHNLRNPITFRKRLNFSNIVRSSLVIKQTNSQNKQFFLKQYRSQLSTQNMEKSKVI